MRISLKNSDNIGILSSTFCFIHCLVTPFIYITFAGFFKESEYHSFYWKGINLVFIIFSLIAVNRSTKKTKSKIIKPIFWLSWSFLFFVLLNEEVMFFELPELISYVSALNLAGVHIYNLKFCGCRDENCCTQETN